MGTSCNDLVIENTNSALKSFKAKLAGKFKVVNASTFAGTDAYRAESIDAVKEGLYSPVLDGKSMLNFSEDRNDIIQGYLPEGSAEVLCKALGFDAVVLVYSEWAVATGKFVPTAKSLAKTCMAMWSKNSEKIFYNRKDAMGDKTLGAMGMVKVNEDTIGQWVLAFEKGIDALLNS